jgi:O-antigen ligase
MRIENIKNIIGKNEESLSLFLICLIAFTIPASLSFGNMAIIIAISFTLIRFKISVLNVLLKPSYSYPIVFFLITIISSLTSKRTDIGFERTDLELLPVLLILIIINQNITKQKLNKVLNYFSISTLVFTTLLIGMASYNYLSNINSGTFHHFTEPFDQHPVYYSMYISISLFYFLTTKGKTRFRNSKLLNTLYCSILLIGLLLCSSKAVIFIDLLLFVLLMLRTKALKQKVIYFITTAAICLILFNTSFIQKRFTEGLTFSIETLQFQPTNNFLEKKQFTYEEKEHISDLELRYIFLKTMLYHCYKDNKVLFGYGQGDTQNYIDYYYYSYNLAPNWYEDYNIHNQYAHLLLTYGVFTLLFFVIYLVYCFRIAFKHNDKLYLFFLIISSFVFIFEVTLVRNKGIIFFYFFNTLFLTQYIYFEDSNFRHKRRTQ